jgi:hypothetical protein
MPVAGEETHMGSKARTIILLAMGALVLLAPTTEASARGGLHEEELEHGHASASSTSSIGNPLIEEMFLLDSVFHEVVSGVSLGDGQRVSNALHSLHGTMERTHEGVHHGTVKIPKNADKVELFVKMDKDFHEDLERLAAAAKKNDQQRMLSLTKKLLDGCVACHGMFRK